MTGKLSMSKGPTINTLGPTVKSHKRHFQQQCEYTFCLQEESGDKCFASHKEAFSNHREGKQYIWKCNIPGSERKKVLGSLDSLNINAFTLFGSIESLMTSTAERYFFLED